MRGLRVRVHAHAADPCVVDEKGPPGALRGEPGILARAVPEQVEIAQAAARLQVPVYVSEAMVDGVTWYRLRAGPFAFAREAERLLRAAQERYPTAWLAIDDEKDVRRAEDGELVTVPKVSAATRPPETRADAALDKSLADARAAQCPRKRCDEAVTLLTRIIAARTTCIASTPRNCWAWRASARASWPRPRRPTRITCGATRTPPPHRASASGCRPCAPPACPAGAAVAAGGATPGLDALMAACRRSIAATTRSCAARRCPATWSTQNAILTDVDGVARRRGERLDFTARVNIGYTNDLLTNGPGDQLRVSSAYVELNDRELGMSARLGRQSRGMAGIPGTFDGLLATGSGARRSASVWWRACPRNPRAMAPDTDRQLPRPGARTSPPPDRSWDTAVYALAQQYQGDVGPSFRRRGIALRDSPAARWSPSPTTTCISPTSTASCCWAPWSPTRAGPSTSTPAGSAAPCSASAMR